MNVIDQHIGENFALYLGDSCRVTPGIPDNSVHLTVSSPPFSTLYIYSDADSDMGNSADDAEFFEHFRYLVPELYRITVPGRLAVMHCKDLPLYRGRDGSAGLSDFPGRLIRAFEAGGWTYHSRVTIWKCPVTEMQRTKNHGLLYKNLRADSCGSRQGMADYVLAFRKWTEDGEFPEPVRHTKEEFPLEQWQEWASPVWMTVDQMDVLPYKAARGDEDQRHICPLQLDVIKRCVALWSNPGDIVFDPFAGIGSTLYQALKMGRRGVGSELKRSYWDAAVANLTQVEQDSARPMLPIMQGQG
jgi:DNA modification methylase